ncbi:electron transfer flavoprotein subunit alpha/FixB family protein [Prauserella muralis]|uniref:Uncharacterized protein n=1 Tax=Prauserella muralis TaxID=588067 RepID=A0A2V4APJ1_9PSEU|nr:electron transfer flavoprotein subunit alpha/FixB family protein [Prauserella muralis]PXY22620.1 hypothetical protein BAY60_22620 [Prauserella muralis]TWE28326.1 electron transfer flavoprotein alpha subunit apoprotein [Prauserella muralis]
MLLIVLDGTEPAPGVLGLAQALGGPVHAVAFGRDDDAAAEIAAGLAKQGVGVLHTLRHPLLGDYGPEAYGEALAQLVGRLRPEGVLAAGTDHGTEILAHTAARTGLPLATNCLSVTGGPRWQLTRVRGGGMLLEDAELDAPVKLVTAAQGAEAPSETAVRQECTVEEFLPDLPQELARSAIVERTPRGGGLTLATAPVVVSGGRGVGSAEGYAVLEELAGLLGGVVGCSRVATNNGWRPHSDQVGLTGTKISPRLYVACGISGATQHWVGCMDSRAILAINTDPDAPLVQRATYAVVGDVHEVVPAIVAELHARGVHPDG